ncbi:uncharacterized protein LOC124418706 [Lucilia cuprina]|uniref:uncharacterized protein LOC124418706 n=1 Tax=Lucilia cuprina TaxID=7375 RepID=UPI001F0628BE|nr:uncharacterized protein LOC124418706 [Lucilia cuprina]
MFAANNLSLLEPNILYLEDKPPKICKTKRKVTNKKSLKKATSKTKQKLPITSKKRSTKIKQDYIIKKELCVLDEQDEIMENNDPNDPLYTAKLEVKSEENDSIQYECETDEQENCDNDKDYNYEQDMFESKLEKYKDECDDSTESENEDEPLIVLSRRRGKYRKKIGNEDNKIPRRVVCGGLCKQHCTEKFTEEQRKNICDYFWSLNEDNRLTFIRKHVKARCLTRTKRVKDKEIRANNLRYYLKAYKIGNEEVNTSDDLITVCPKFFKATLCTTSNFIKMVNEATVLEIEKELLLLSQKKAMEKEKPREPQQILDPETGNLTVATNLRTQNVSHEKKKHIRRKPGDPKPEHFPKSINCVVRCIHKCHTKFTEEERKQICDLFWSMDYKRRKDFVLAAIEVKDVENPTTPDFRTSYRPPRTQQRRYFLRSGGMRGENLRVCKHFYIRTLCINSNFIDNAVKFADKTTGCYTGADRRGGHTPNEKTEARKQRVLTHINSYAYWIPNKKTKTKYLHHSLSIKKMYDDYKEKCLAEKIQYVSTFYYYTAFHDHFNLLFLANPRPRKGCALQKGNPTISHYTGEEPGGCWIDSKGNKLDLRSIDPARSLNRQCNSTEDLSENTFSVLPHQPLNLQSSTSLMQPNPTAQSLTVVRSELNTNLYGNLIQDSINVFKML